ncbi:MAG TPA: hypothetical protein VF210_15555 [Pseudomonadales bacterium]
MRLVLLIVAATLAAPSFAAVRDRADERPPAADGAANERPNERIICEKITPIGTRIPQRICRTETQIRVMREEGREWAAGKQERAVRSGGLPPGVGGGPG